MGLIKSAMQLMDLSLESQAADDAIAIQLRRLLPAAQGSKIQFVWLYNRVRVYNRHPGRQYDSMNSRTSECAAAAAIGPGPYIVSTVSEKPCNSIPSKTLDYKYII